MICTIVCQSALQVDLLQAVEVKRVMISTTRDVGRTTTRDSSSLSCQQISNLNQDMDFTTGLPASPGTPLFPVSPERANRQHYAAPGYSKQAPYGRPVSTLGLSSLSPGGGTTNLALLADSSDSRPTRGSDVQEKVAQFNTLARDAAQRRRDHEAALKRAILGREEAEAENVRLKEELSNLRHERDRVKREETRTRGEKGQAELLVSHLGLHDILTLSDITCGVFEMRLSGMC